jgi:hypothetical protein
VENVENEEKPGNGPPIVHSPASSPRAGSATPSS